MLQLTQVTVSGNTATADGGGIAVANAQTTITNSTITSNRADHDGRARTAAAVCS